MLAKLKEEITKFNLGNLTKSRNSTPSNSNAPTRIATPFTEEELVEREIHLYNMLYQAGFLNGSENLNTADNKRSRKINPKKKF